MPSKLNELLEEVKPPAKVTPAAKVEAAHGLSTMGAPKARIGRTPMVPVFLLPPPTAPLLKLRFQATLAAASDEDQ